jgi:hypothetical protein
MNDFRTKLTLWIRNWQREQAATPKILMIATIMAAGLVWFCTRGSSDPRVDTDDRVTADTFVPKGLVLVPIEVENYQSLESILGPHGVVDLYTMPVQPGEKARKVASGIKILRAPLNPSQFAVLANSQDAPELVHAGHYFVVVKNPQETGTHIERVEKAQPKLSHLIVETIE